MQERKFVRIRSDFNVWYQSLSEEEMSFGKPPSKNVSAGGVLVETDEMERVGTNLVLRFEIPNYNKKIEAKGRVAWVKKLDSGRFDMGIEFTDIPEEDINAINKLDQ